VSLAQHVAMPQCAQARKREKEADERDRAKLKQKLEEDRKERRRKLGKPEELTEEEKVGRCCALLDCACCCGAPCKELTEGERVGHCCVPLDCACCCRRLLRGQSRTCSMRSI